MKTLLVYYTLLWPFVGSSANLQNTTHDGQNQEESSVASGRLPPSLEPLHYTLHLQPFLTGNLSIHGSLHIHFRVLHVTDKVVLNMADIITNNNTVKVTRKEEGVGAEVVRQTYNPLLQLYTAHLNTHLSPNTTWSLSMDFQGFLNDKLVGFYRSTYTDDQGSTRVVAGTQFSPSDARRAFPCFDEPALKATFDIHLARPQHLTSLSNMPLLHSTSIKDQPGWVLDTFATTLPMSTYLVGFLVCDYSHQTVTASNSTHNHTLIKVWTRAEALNQTSLATRLTPSLLSFLERYFELFYPLPKLDVATMSDFKFGAMENWGLILYKESRLLHDPKKSSAKSKLRTGTIIAHELAHQWFGNLVTPAWWSELWLKEGFATYMGFVALNDTESTWEVMEQFLTLELHPALALDSLLSSHPINVEVTNPDDVSQMFDTISYKKGSSIIRMMQNFLTEKTFRKGLKNYLNTLKYKSATQEDLWKHLTDAAREDGVMGVEMSVKEVMDTWTLQMGYPVISVFRNGSTATLTQNWFTLDDEVKKLNMTEEGQTWWIPISYTTQTQLNFSQTHPQRWMSPATHTIQMTGLPNENQWIVVNVQQTGFYRVNYDANNWDLLRTQLESSHTTIHSTNRAQILNDAFSLARAGLLNYTTALGLTTYMVREEGLVPWNAVLPNLRYLLDMFGRSSSFGALRDYVRQLVVQMYDSVGFIDDLTSPLVTQLKRVVAVDQACSLAHPPCVHEASAVFEAWIADPHNTSIVTGNTAKSVLCTGLSAGVEGEWDSAWQRYRNSNVATEKVIILNSLGCTKVVWLLARYLEMAFTPDSGVRKQDASTVFTSVARNPIGRDLAWNFVQEKWTHILQYLGPGSSHLSRIVKAATKTFNTPLLFKELERFQSQHTTTGHLGSATRAVQQALESTRLNVKWMRHNYHTIVDWLAGHGFTSTIN
ncbi:hypothetical protein Pcinc_005432 [Petrolisthes cinctipes]|uniref:Aminopeptidase n=1 Tax=Petrolisthes cinctipes TaxID=88211 RepID=A0AAE1GEX3_PETCI|nr:hypothetical protein Pcinc_005432 [Petrolisthes cinctipes]